jgi:hypothetical protein
MAQVQQVHIDRELQHIHERLLHGPDAWYHHVADLSGDGEVKSSQSDRPITTYSRSEQLGDITKSRLPVGIFDLAERTLTAQAPYQESPLSYLDAWGPRWSLWAEANRLEWADFAPPAEPELDFGSSTPHPARPPS